MDVNNVPYVLIQNVVNMPYIDVKYTIWQRAYISEDADINKLIEEIKNGDLSSIYAPEYGFLSNEILIDTDELMGTGDNDGFSTVEIYNDNHEMIFENGQLPYKDLSKNEINKS